MLVAAFIRSNPLIQKFKLFSPLRLAKFAEERSIVYFMKPLEFNAKYFRCGKKDLASSFFVQPVATPSSENIAMCF